MEASTRVVRTYAGTSAIEGVTLAYRVMCLYAVVAVGRITEFLPAHGAVPLAKILAVLAIVLIALSRKNDTRQRLLKLPITKLVVALFFLSVTSVLFSIWKSNTLRFNLNVVLTVCVSFLLVAKVLSNWREVKGFIKSIVVAGVSLAVIGIVSFTGGRLEVTQSYDPNDIAYVLVSILPLGLAIALISSGLARALWFLSCLLLIAVVLLTQSRGGLLALGAIALSMVWKPFVIRSSRHAKQRETGKRLWIILLIAALLAGSFTMLPPDARERFASLLSLQSDYNLDMSNETGRLALWTRSVTAAIDRPIGYGSGNFAAVDGMTGGRYKAAHNSFILVFVELGVVGLLLFIWLYVVSFRVLRAVIATFSNNRDGATDAYEKAVMSRGLELSLLGTCVAGFFLSQTYSNLLWLILGVVAALSAQLPRSGTLAANGRWPWGRSTPGRPDDAGR